VELYRFQELGVRKLAPQRSRLVGDDMGLGKTVTAIKLDHVNRRQHNCDYSAQTLVCTTKSMMGSMDPQEEGGWAGHFRTWSPHLKVYVIDPKNRRGFLQAIEEKQPNGLPKYQVFIAHWQVLRFMHEEMWRRNWFHVIADEVQYIKNPKAQVTRVFKSMRPYYKTAMSGTWADNKPTDAWGPLNWLWPDQFRSKKAFEDYHVIWEEKYNQKTGKYYKVIKGTANEEELHQFIAPAYIRRMKTEVLEDFPEKLPPQNVYVDLDPKQRRAYNQMRDDMLAWIGEHEHEPVAAPVVVSQLIRLQQFACAYGQLETVMKNGEPRRVLRLADPSSKLDALMEIVENSHEPIVVFSQSKQVLGLLGSRLQSRDISHVLFTGDTPAPDRTRMVREFQSGAHRVFAATIASGGEGITLTRASTAVFVDLAWSPSKNKQAEDRLHRLGQKNAVQIIRLVARGTIDSRRNESIDLKWSWLRRLLDPKGPQI